MSIFDPAPVVFSRQNPEWVKRLLSTFAASAPRRRLVKVLQLPDKFDDPAHDFGTSPATTQLLASVPRPPKSFTSTFADRRRPERFSTPRPRQDQLTASSGAWQQSSFSNFHRPAENAWVSARTEPRLVPPRSDAQLGLVANPTRYDPTWCKRDEDVLAPCPFEGGSPALSTIAHLTGADRTHLDAKSAGVRGN